MQTVVITGAASGIGQGLARRLSGTVPNLVLWDRNEAGLQETAARCVGAPPATRRVDVSSEADVAAAYRELAERGLTPDLLFHAAGILHTGGLEALSIDDCRADMSVNYFGTVNVLVHAARHMREGGRIICISSAAGLKGLPEFPGYCASKFAVYGFCESVEPEFRKKGIALSVLCPPAVDTPMVRNLPSRPVIYDVFPFAPLETVLDTVVAAARRRDEFLLLVDAQTRALRLANGVAPRAVTKLFETIVDWKRKSR